MEPLSSLLRPQTLQQFVGQSHLVGEGKPLSSFLEHKNIPSLFFRGPPGCGKTTLARIISKILDADFFHCSGVSSKKDDLMKIVAQAEANKAYAKQTVLFLDEIHRWNKAQQDVLLPFVEDGTITLIGATTENPSFSINNALLSRCRVFVFEPISHAEVIDFFTKNIETIYTQYPGYNLTDENFELIAKLADGDLRNAINILESVLMMQKENVKTGKNKKIQITDQDILDAGQKNIAYDRDGDQHYQIISAFIKSMRGSNPDAACYRLQRMIKGGEDPVFIARRMLIFASEDIGLANNNAILIANQVFDAVQKIGYPEAEFPLFHGAIYMAQSAKGDAVYRAMRATREEVDNSGTLKVPFHLRNADTKLQQELGYGEGYKYPHNYPNSKVEQIYLPDEIKNKIFFKE